jgi:hypothetical protein
VEEWVAALPAREAGLQQASAFESARAGGETEDSDASAADAAAPPRGDLPVRATHTQPHRTASGPTFSTCYSLSCEIVLLQM